MAVWDSIKADLRHQMTDATWLQLISPTTATETAGRLVVHHPNSGMVDILAKRHSQQISRVAESHQPGLAIDFVYGSQPSPPATPAPAAGAEKVQPPPDHKISVDGYYQHAYTAIVQPDKIEAFTQYFRWRWRPLLGPGLSELVRELRQMCYLGKGREQTRRNTVEITQHELARRLGISRATLQRYLQRDRYGRFTKNQYLNKFILEVETITRYDEDKRRVVNDKTRYTIAIDEPIAPEDEAEYKKYSKPQNDA